MRARFTPRSLAPSREADRTWMALFAGSAQNSASSTKPSQRVEKRTYR